MLRIRGTQARVAIAALLVIGGLAAGCQQRSPSPTEEVASGTEVIVDENVLAAFVLLTEDIDQNTVAYARVVIDGAGQPCPVLTLPTGGTPLTTTARSNPHHKHFPITVCEAQVPFGQELVVGNVTIAAVNKNPEQVLVYGDTGCNASDQDCSDSTQWPFRDLINQGARDNPALILHMGDYNYRGTPGHVDINGKKHSLYDAGDHNPTDPDCSLKDKYRSMNAKGSNAPDKWDNWNLDFFTPAAALLPKAPWVFARGNHELCSRAGPGWFYLLDAGTNLPGAAHSQRECQHQSHDTPLATSGLEQLTLADPYIVDLENLRIAVVDSANACDNFAPGQTTGLYQTQFNTLGERMTGTTPGFFMTHRPLWGVASDSNVVNQTLQTALAGSEGKRLPDATKLSLAGHQHRYETLSFPQGSDRPPQITIGNSGVVLASDKPGPCLTLLPVDKVEACGFIATRFGYLSLAQGIDGNWNSWTGVVATTAAPFIALCDSTRPQVCIGVAQQCTCSATTTGPQ